MFIIIIVKQLFCVIWQKSNSWVAWKMQISLIPIESHARCDWRRFSPNENCADTTSNSTETFTTGDCSLVKCIDILVGATTEEELPIVVVSAWEDFPFSRFEKWMIVLRLDRAGCRCCHWSWILWSCWGFHFACCWCSIRVANLLWPLNDDHKMSKTGVKKDRAAASKVGRWLECLEIIPCSILHQNYRSQWFHQQWWPVRAAYLHFLLEESLFLPVLYLLILFDSSSFVLSCIIRSSFSSSVTSFLLRSDSSSLLFIVWWERCQIARTVRTSRAIRYPALRWS